MKEYIKYPISLDIAITELISIHYFKSLIVKVVVSKNIYFLFFQVIRYRIRSDYHHFE